MKKLFLLFLIPFIFISCKQEDNEPTESPEEIAAREEFEYLKNYYNQYLVSVGKWKLAPVENQIDNSDETEIKSVIFEKDKVVLGSTVYELDIYNYETFSVEMKRTGGLYNEIHLTNMLLYYSLEYNITGVETPLVLKFNNLSGLRFTYIPDVSSGSSSETGDIKGSYNFNSASGYQKNGKITLENGNWSYSGEKTNAAATSGTYTVSGSKVTVNWVASGMDLSETFTVTTDGSSSTWVSNESGASPFLVMLFGTTDTQITFSYSE